MDIRILPGNIANMIAAGEVVQRPASVVKELMENAIDAGADHVSVVIRDAGKTLIQVIDNGCGMSPDDAVVCFERHATSKISSKEDLMRIVTFGFRGEALASIAAVAEVTLKTRRDGDELGCEVVFADSRHVSTNEISAPKGANFAVRNLFYNVPARRKFLKSDNVEFKHIVSEFTHVALTRYDREFDLVHNDREVYVLKPAKSLKFRIQDMFGKGVAQSLVDISAKTSVVEARGYVARPDTATKSQSHQYFFINGRYFRSPYFHKAVMRAYENLLPEGCSPSYFIYLETAPDAVDVNISPTKTEIKFEDDSVIFQILYACIKEALGKNSFGASIDFDVEGTPEIPVFGRHFDDLYHSGEPEVGTDSGYNPFDNDGFPSEEQHFSNVIGGGFPQDGGFFPSQVPQEEYPTAERPERSPVYGTSGFVDSRDDYGKLFEDKTLPTKSVLILHGKYILTQVKSGLLVVNIRRATERVLFERFLQAYSGSGHLTQTALFPVSVQIGVENVLLLQDHADMLSSLGFDIVCSGNDTIVVNGVPEGYSAEPGKVQAMVTDLISVLSDDRSLLPETMASSVAGRFAKIGASGRDCLTSPIEAQRLIDSLFACTNAEYTSTGHRIMTIIPIGEIDKEF